MNVFHYGVSQETRLNCIQRMLFNFAIELKINFKEMNNTYLQGFYRLLGLRKAVLTQILNALELHEKVIVAFDMDSRGKRPTLEFKVRSADDHRWEDLFDGLDGNCKGLCLTASFDGDGVNSPWLFFTEKELRGSALAKVFDIK